MRLSSGNWTPCLRMAALNRSSSPWMAAACMIASAPETSSRPLMALNPPTPEPVFEPSPKTPMIIIRPEGGTKHDDKRYLMPTHAHLSVREGDRVHAGDR